MTQAEKGRILRVPSTKPATVGRAAMHQGTLTGAQTVASL